MTFDPGSQGPAETFYDRVPYPSLSFGATHPDHLATVAALLGLSAPPVERCRVLELGCASGGNLIPMAYSLPGSEFVGIDYARRQVAEGRARINELGLTNLTLQHANILDVTPEHGQFDYIIVHGVYSWVPVEVRAKILDVCRENLVANGVAYVSYNTFPGWHMIQMARDLMLYATRDVTDPREKASKARAVVKFYSENIPESNAYGSWFRTYNTMVDEKLDATNDGNYASVLHDELEDINDPVYFHQFAADAARHGLHYLADADFTISTGNRIPDQVHDRVMQLAGDDPVEAEQFADFLACRSFRRSLLCRADALLDNPISSEPIKKMYAAAPAQPASAEPDLYSLAIEKFEGTDQAAISTNHPVSKIALVYLRSIYPQSVAFADLLAGAQAELRAERERRRATGADLVETPPAGEEADGDVLAANLLTSYGYSRQLLELHVWPPSYHKEVSERPVISSVARLEARRGPWVTNTRHERVRLDEINRYLLPYIDGSHDHAALVDVLMNGPVAEGILTAELDEQPVQDQAVMRELIEQGLPERLERLARTSLLVA